MAVIVNHLKGGIYRLGLNDRRIALFENLWPLPEGVSYNCYLIKDRKCALLDTAPAGVDLVECVSEVLDGRELDYLVVHHMEPDHSSQIEALRRRYPSMQVVGNKKTLPIFEAYFGRCDQFLEVSDGFLLDLGGHKLNFVLTPWLHWPETMMSYEPATQTLFTADAFGMFGALNGGVFDDQADFSQYESSMLRYYANIVGKYSQMVQKALQKLQGIPVKAICPLHGLVWRSDPGKAVGLYDRWSRFEADNGVAILYGSMYGFTASMADHIGVGLADRGVRKIQIIDVSKTHLSYQLEAAWRYRGLILGSSSYNTRMLPPMEIFCREMEHAGLKKRLLGIFGTGSWSGGGVRNLLEFAGKVDWEMVADPVEITGAPSNEKLKRCDLIAEAMAAKMVVCDV